MMEQYLLPREAGRAAMNVTRLRAIMHRYRRAGVLLVGTESRQIKER